MQMLSSEECWAHFSMPLPSEILVPQILAALEALNYNFYLPSPVRFGKAFLVSLPLAVVPCLNTLQVPLGDRERRLLAHLSVVPFSLGPGFLKDWPPQRLPHDFKQIYFCILIGLSTFSHHKRWSATSYSI